MQNQQLVSLARKHNITVTDTMTDDQIQSAIDAKFSELNDAKLKSEKLLSDEKTAKATELVEAAIAAGKVSPQEGENFAERKEAMIKFAETDYNAAKKMFDGMTGDPDKSILTPSGLATNKVDFKTGKNPSGGDSKVTFDDVLSDPAKYMGKFSDDELKKMHEADGRWKNIGLGVQNDSASVQGR